MSGSKDIERQEQDKKTSSDSVDVEAKSLSSKEQVPEDSQASETSQISEVPQVAKESQSTEASQVVEEPQSTESSQVVEEQEARGEGEVLPPEGKVIYDSSDQEDLKEMGFFDHIKDLRQSLVRAVISWIIACIPTWYAVGFLVDHLRDHMVGKETKLLFLSPAEAFLAYFKITMLGGFFLAFPFILYQLWVFVAPGLLKNEKRWFYFIVPFSMLLFLGGVAFAYFIALPVTLRFLLSFATESLEAQLRIGDFISFVVGFCSLLGISFQLPIVLILLSRLGLVSSKSLGAHRRIAILASFCIAAIATPTPDAFTMCLVALPLTVLYEISVVIIRITGK